MIKNDQKKLIVVNYSPDVYTISKILKKDLVDTRDHLRRKVEFENLRYTIKLNGVEVQTQQKMNNPDKRRESKRFFGSDFIKIDKNAKNTFLEQFSIQDAMKLNKEENALLPREEERDEVKKMEKKKEMNIFVDKLIGREIKKKVKKFGYLVGKVESFSDPFYKVVYNDNESENLKRPVILKYLVDLENNNPRIGLRERKKKEVVIGGNILTFF